MNILIRGLGQIKVNEFSMLPVLAQCYGRADAHTQQLLRSALATFQRQLCSELVVGMKSMAFWKGYISFRIQAPNDRGRPSTLSLPTLIKQVKSKVMREIPPTQKSIARRKGICPQTFGLMIHENLHLPKRHKARVTLNTIHYSLHYTLPLPWPADALHDSVLINLLVHLTGVSVSCNSGSDVASIPLQFIRPSDSWSSWAPMPFNWAPDLLFWSSSFCLVLQYDLLISISLFEQR
ncbi:hypothetical protein C0J52_12800 [Blattella germanica]|nr:hypothetical protein C0J52_12800 [Blattella germanica]